MDGGTDRLTSVHRALLEFEPAAIVTDNIWGYLWGKMGYGALLFATALTNASIVEVLESRDARAALTALAREVMAVAAAERVRVMPFNGYDPAAFGAHGTAAAIDASFDAMIAFNRRSAKTHTGVWRDIAIHHRQTECDAQFAPILNLARTHDLPLPALTRLVALMREVESGARPQAMGEPREVVARCRRGEDRCTFVLTAGPRSSRARRTASAARLPLPSRASAPMSSRATW